jgi:small-conductance mechanosensitive channel
MINILNYTLLGNTVQDYIISLGVFLLVFLFLKFFKLVVIKRLHKLAEKTSNDLDDALIKAIDSIGFIFYFIVSVFFAAKFIYTSGLASRIISYSTLFIVIYQGIKLVQNLIDYGVEALNKKMGDKKGFDSSLSNLLGKVIKVVIWAGAILIVLQNFGINVSAIVAGLGIGGLAIAFAIQNILGDIFASFSIYFDKPFQVGDFIMFEDKSGTVKKVGIRSTRIETLQGEELIVSNTNLINSQIHNFKKLKKRRVVLNLSVTYETSNDKLKMIPGLIKTIIDKAKDIEFDRSNFSKFEDSGLSFETIYYIGSQDYYMFMDKQQEVNFAIKEVFEKEGIEFAYPTVLIKR